jgi:hypothetical protein
MQINLKKVDWIMHKSMAVTCHTSFFALIGNTENPPFRPPPPDVFVSGMFESTEFIQVTSNAKAY